MRTAKDAARRLLDMTVPENIRARFAEEYGLALSPGDTYGVVLLKAAKPLSKTSPAFAELVRRWDGND